VYCFIVVKLLLTYWYMKTLKEMNAFMSELVLQSVGLACVLFINILSILS